MNELNEEQLQKLAADECPECGGNVIIFGFITRMGAGRHILCGTCLQEFEVIRDDRTKRGANRAVRNGKPDAERLNDEYDIANDHRPVAKLQSLRPQNRLEMEKILLSGCGDPECESHHEHEPLQELYLHSACHHGAPFRAVYKRGGELWLKCVECNRVVIKVIVSDELK